MIKKPFALLIIFILFSIVLKAQDYSIGGGLGYGSQINTIGLNFRGDVKFHKQWSITPHFNYFFSRTKAEITNKWNALNVDGHYFIEIDKGWILYPLFGINIANVSSKVNDITFTNSDVGINLGFGSEYNFDRRFSGFGEAKYVISNADQLVITFGVLYKL
jgi:hypothetical protein